jgi:hypothetical protein
MAGVRMETMQPADLDCWTRRQTELRAWFQRNAPSLGELYEGAIRLIYKDRVPGWTRFVAHAVREIRNGLPDAISGARSGGSLQYKNRLDDLVEVWRNAGLPTDGSSPGTVLGAAGQPPPTPDVPVPRCVYKEVADLVRDHLKAREKPVEAAARLFEAIAPENQALRGSLRPFIGHWVTVTNWFVEKAHDSGRTDGDVDEAEFRKKIELFETTLVALMRHFFVTVKELDEILEDANS